MTLSRSTPEEKELQLKNLQEFQERHKDKREPALNNLKKVVLNGDNIFEELLNTVQLVSLGEITRLLYEVGGKYRRNV